MSYIWSQSAALTTTGNNTGMVAFATVKPVTGSKLT